MQGVGTNAKPKPGNAHLQNFNQCVVANTRYKCYNSSPSCQDSRMGLASGFAGVISLNVFLVGFSFPQRCSTLQRERVCERLSSPGDPSPLLRRPRGRTGRTGTRTGTCLVSCHHCPMWAVCRFAFGWFESDLWFSKPLAHWSTWLAWDGLGPCWRRFG